jgi:hypothetical protein
MSSRTLTTIALLLGASAAARAQTYTCEGMPSPQCTCQADPQAASTTCSGAIPDSGKLDSSLVVPNGDCGGAATVRTSRST